MENSARPETPAPTSPPVVQPTHRGLYITLGAFLVFAVVALGGIYVPKYAKTHALGGNSAATAPAAAPVAAAPAAVPAAPAAPAPVAAAPAKPQDASASAPAVPPGPDPKVLQGLRDQIDQINSRAAAVDAGLDSLERQQEAQGYGLRGDMVAGRQRMHADIARAESSLHEKDVEHAELFEYGGGGSRKARAIPGALIRYDFFGESLPAASRRSGRLRAVFSRAFLRRQRLISSWLPLTRISGTSQPRKDCGRV
jgi:hypothetical protein